MNLVNWGSLKNEFAFSDHSFARLVDSRIQCPMEGNLEIFLTSYIEFLFIVGQHGDNYCKQNLIVERKEGVIKRPRLLNPGKTIAMAICPINVHFTLVSQHAHV